jgi:ABC-type phosphate/phosphonate transport system permease subunit
MALALKPFLTVLLFLLFIIIIRTIPNILFILLLLPGDGMLATAGPSATLGAAYR